MIKVTRNSVLKDAARQFAQKAGELAEVAEIAICGSVAGNDPNPSDIDLAVIMTYFSLLEPLAKYARQMSSISHAWEVFVFDHLLIREGYAIVGNVPGSPSTVPTPIAGRFPTYGLSLILNSMSHSFLSPPSKSFTRPSRRAIYSDTKSRLGLLSPGHILNLSL
ncbi:MAG: hypothetical protein NTX36_15855 [Proteobacteria bacterium]|nr:hypothetical protein [Pseudomonadota bacterium]